jgi:predicted nuclease of predicted toxin-antitoxin system
VTLDKDFGELAVAFGRAHAGIIRIVNFPISKHAAVCIRALEQHGPELARGAIITAEPGRLRVRPPS